MEVTFRGGFQMEGRKTVLWLSGISILYNILEMNAMFFSANPTKAPYIPSPEGRGFMAHSIR